MKRQEYLDLQAKHRKELEEFPIAYAFNEKQLEEALEKLGATREECITVFDHGDIVKRTDAKALVKMLERQTKELREKMRTDKEFAYEAFLYEMDNHEYAINWSADEDVLDSLSLTWDMVRKWGLQMVYDQARNQHMRNAEEWGMI
jgi:hypothetical protein